METTRAVARHRLDGVAAWTAVLTAMARKELTVMARYPLEFVAGFLQVFLMVTVFTLAALLFAPPGTRSVEGGALIGGIMVCGFIVFIFFTEAVWSVGYSLRREQRQGTLEQFHLSRASASAGLVARASVVLLWTGLLAALSIALMAAIIGGLHLANLLLALVILGFTLAGVFGVGFAFAGVTLRAGESAQLLATLLQFGFLVLCAPFFPFAVLPDWLRMVSRAVPLSYGVDAFRSTLLGWPGGYPELAPMGVALAVVVGFGIAMPVLGMRIYRGAERWALREGRLSDY